MPLANPIADPNNVRHVYRHLLREISYLPPPARPWAAKRACDRFRARPLDANKLSERECRLSARRRLLAAHGAISRVRAANSGHAARMVQILFEAFGRRGRRRRELTEELVYKGGKAAKDGIAARLVPLPSVLISQAAVAQDGAEGTSMVRSKSQRRWDWLDKWDTDKLKIYLKSQKQHAASVSTEWPTKSSYKVTDPASTIPAQNIWQRDWNPKTYKTKLAKSWKRAAEKIQPPLPEREWEMIRRIALNEDIPDAWKMPTRRRLVSSLFADPSDGAAGWKWHDLATEPVRHVERPKAPRNIRLTGETDNGPYGRQNKGPATDGRWVRRIFTTIWQASSTIKKDPFTAKESIVWGKKTRTARHATALQSELFEGVDSKGAIIPPNRS